MMKHDEKDKAPQAHDEKLDKHDKDKAEKDQPKEPTAKEKAVAELDAYYGKVKQDLATQKATLDAQALALKDKQDALEKSTAALDKDYAKRKQEIETYPESALPAPESTVPWNPPSPPPPPPPPAKPAPAHV